MSEMTEAPTSYDPQLTEGEIALREQFAKEYIADFDPYHATLRMGYTEARASAVASQFMQCAWTLKRIQALQASLGLDSDEKIHRQRIIGGLYREASLRSNSASARVAAYAQLAKILGLEAPVKQETHMIHDEITFRVVEASQGVPVAG